MIWMHKCTRVRDAQTAERLGADLMEIVGFEAAGHPSMEEVTTLVLLPQTIDSVKIPVIGGGGFSDARGFVAALALGAEGVMMGTRFMLTRECKIHDNVRKTFVDAKETDTILIQRSINNPVRAIKNNASLKVQEMEQRGTTLEELLPIIDGARGRNAMATGDIDEGIISCGQVVGLLHDVPSVQEVVDSIINGAMAICQRLSPEFPKA